MKIYATLPRQERIQKIMNQRRSDLALVLENLSEDINISAILRTAESFGVGRVFVVHPRGGKPRISKGATSGAYKWLNIEYFTSIKKCIKKLKKEDLPAARLPAGQGRQGFKIIGALVDPNAKILWEQKFEGKIAILVGNEAHGMSEEAQEQVDENIYLPMFGLTESLNVSVASGIFLYEVIRQKEKNE